MKITGHETAKEGIVVNLQKRRVDSILKIY